jgi:hypothetical protein
MKNTLLIVLIWIVIVLSSFGQTTSQVFYNGRETPEEMWTWPWGFSQEPVQVDNAGYTPGTAAYKWGTPLIGDETQGLFFGYDNGFNFTSVWPTESVHFKLKAPNGVSGTDTLLVWLYDNQTSNWDYAVYYKLENFQDLNDGEWHQFNVPLSSFITNVNPIDQSNITAVSLEAYNFNLISAEFYIDDVWIGDPNIHATMTLFNGMSVVNGVGTEVWGFQDNTFKIAEGEGYTFGTNAVLWENNNTNGPLDAGIGFYFAPQNFTYGFTVDTFKIKIKAPAGINDLALVLWDQSYNTAIKVLDNITWNGDWQIIEAPLSAFTQSSGLDLSDIYYFSLAPASTPIPERVLFTDIWIGNPFIDFTPPPVPTGLLVDYGTPYLNFIYWDNIDSETGEVYDIYTSMDPITDLSAPGVYAVSLDVPEGSDPTMNVVHRIFYPLMDGEVSHYYAVSVTDAAGNVSETFATTTTPFTNTGKKCAIISLDPPNSFNANGDLSEWSSIVPFRMLPDHPDRIWGTIDDSLDYSAYCYVAMDNENLYVAFDVFDDVYSYQPTNTQPWWEDEAIEFFFGLYKLNSNPHSYFMRGAEPDYRVVFKPYEIELYSGGTIANNTANYYFESGGQSDYVLEAKIPFSDIQLAGDSLFTLQEGMTIPFEIFATDADVVDGGAQGRLQYGYNPAKNPWGGGPLVWTYAWIGMPPFTDVEDEGGVVNSYKLFNNYPNPFNPTTNIRYQVAEPGHVSIKIYDMLGCEVADLVNEEQAAGSYNVKFDGFDLASGIYFYQIKSGSFLETKKMMLLK